MKMRCVLSCTKRCTSEIFHSVCCISAVTYEFCLHARVGTGI